MVRLNTPNTHYLCTFMFIKLIMDYINKGYIYIVIQNVPKNPTFCVSVMVNSSYCILPQWPRHRWPAIRKRDGLLGVKKEKYRKSSSLMCGSIHVTLVNNNENSPLWKGAMINDTDLLYHGCYDKWYWFASLPIELKWI